MTGIDLATFREKVAPIVRLCEHIIGRYGGRRVRPRTIADVPRGHVWHTTGYLFSAPIQPASELDYAVRVLAQVQRAMRTKGDTGKNLAWDAALLLMEASSSLTQRRHSTAAAHAAAAQRTRAALTTSPALGWLAEVEARRSGLSKAAVYTHIERREGLRPGTVKKAILRHIARRRRK